MNHLFFIVFTLTSFAGFAQKTVYCLPGQGADRREFSKLQFPSDLNVVYLEYGTPEKGQSMHDFAGTLVTKIDTTEPFILLGVSLGGMLCVELNDFVSPEYTLLISSAKTRMELPASYRFQQKIPLYKVVPKRMIRSSAIALQPLVEKDSKKERETFESMIRSKDPVYMKRTVGMIVEWERTESPVNIFHIHGDNDHTLPLKNIENPQIIIEGGSHMMVLTRAEDISTEIAYLFNTPL